MDERTRQLVGALALAASFAAQAQSGADLSPMPEASATECLTLVPSAPRSPAYPESELTLKEEALVRVRLVFDRSDAEPTAAVFYNKASPLFSDAVLAHVRNYRLPCMSAGATPVVATQEFRFTLDGRKVFYGGLRDTPAANRSASCLVGDDAQPEYPRNLRGERPQGNVIVALSFFDPSEAPKVEVLTDAGSAVLRRAVLAAVERYRLPCLPASARPYKAMRTFTFRLEGARQYTLKDLTLQQFVDGMDKLEQQRVRFDFSTMNCPFEVRLRLYQPFAKNSVGEVERSDPNRREFIEWLKGLALKLPDEAARQIVGQSATISVPCGVLDLT